MLIVGLVCSPLLAADRLCNFVILFADDLGYGDLSCFGHPTIHTPHLDRMAAEGMRFTQFYSAASLCTPSRAALLTGRYQIRSGMTEVLFPKDKTGLPAGEITIAEALKTKGYATACIGKWHLGHQPEFYPTRQGFDYYFGLPYSNDMTPSMKRRRQYPPLPLIRNEQVIETEPDQTLLTGRYTEEAVGFIKENKDTPFLLYFAHSFPHRPLFASKRFKGKSRRGLYGDVVEEIDWSVGEVLKTLRDLRLAENTFVFFTSDNGADLWSKVNGGSAGLFTGGKAQTHEGGIREPAIAWWPGRIPAGRVSREISITMDLFTTCLTLAGVEIPQDRPIDGVNLLPVLEGKGSLGERTLFFYRGGLLQAVRRGPWKLSYYAPGKGLKPGLAQSGRLYNLPVDPSEKYDLADRHPEIVAMLKKEMGRFKASLK
jgi:arylsulfatase A-like enzyme